MSSFSDQPDYHSRSTPGVTRWAPGTEFGNISWTGDVAANTIKEVVFPMPNTNYYYVIDKTFIHSNIVGNIPVAVFICADNGTPVWSVIAVTEQEQRAELAAFTFVSMSLCYPQAIKVAVKNTNNVTRSVSIYTSMYRYLSSG